MNFRIGPKCWTSCHEDRLHASEGVIPSMASHRSIAISSLKSNRTQSYRKIDGERIYLVKDLSFRIWNNEHITKTICRFRIMEAFRHLFSLEYRCIRNLFQSFDDLIRLDDTLDHRCSSSSSMLTFPCTVLTFSRGPER